MLVEFSAEYTFLLRMVAIMLVIPLDTSEAERIFSLMNDIKTDERSSLGQRNLVNLMIWHYYGKHLKPWEVPVQEILKEFHAMVEDKVCGRTAHTAATPIQYGYRSESSSVLATPLQVPQSTGALGQAGSGHPEFDSDGQRVNGVLVCAGADM